MFVNERKTAFSEKVERGEFGADDMVGLLFFPAIRTLSKLTRNIYA